VCSARTGRVADARLSQVLAIRKALSIQAHPDKKLAQKLFAEHPEIYKGESDCLRFAPSFADFLSSQIPTTRFALLARALLEVELTGCSH